MFDALIASFCILSYFCVAAFMLVRFVAADMRYFWSIGEGYEDEDLNAAMVHGSVRAIFWPFVVFIVKPIQLVLRGFRAAISGGAYRIAQRAWDRDEPETETPPVRADIRTTEVPRLDVRRGRHRHALEDTAA